MAQIVSAAADTPDDVNARPVPWSAPPTTQRSPSANRQPTSTPLFSLKQTSKRAFMEDASPGPSRLRPFLTPYERAELSPLLRTTRSTIKTHHNKHVPTSTMSDQIWKRPPAVPCLHAPDYVDFITISCNTRAKHYGTAPNT